MVENGYNYVQTATGPCTEAGSARYDRVYNTFSLRQEFERAFDKFEPIDTHWRFHELGRERLVDPYRYMLAWDSEEEMEQELIDHQKAVREAFTTAKVVIITVGQAEIWYDKRDGTVFPVVPPTQKFDPEIHGFRMSTYQENLENLQRTYALLKANNPEAHIVVTVSPVPLRATFRSMNSVVSNSASKSMLRAVVDEFVRTHSDVSYFPAYEVVLCATDTPFKEDARHVRRETVNSIMGLFEEWFVGKEELQNVGERLNAAYSALADGNLTKATTLLEDISKEIEARSGSESHPLTRHRADILENLGLLYLRFNRHGDAYDKFLAAMDQKAPDSDGWGRLLTNVAALAMDFGDFDRVPDVIRKLLAEPEAPLMMFFHWLGILEKLKGADVARAALDEGNMLCPRMSADPEFEQFATRYGLMG